MTTNKSSEITTVPSYGSWHWPANKKTTERFKKTLVLVTQDHAFACCFQYRLI